MLGITRISYNSVLQFEGSKIVVREADLEAYMAQNFMYYMGIRLNMSDLHEYMSHCFYQGMEYNSKWKLLTFKVRFDHDYCAECEAEGVKGSDECTTHEPIVYDESMKVLEFAELVKF